MKNLAVMTLFLFGTLYVSANSDASESNNSFEQGSILSSVEFAIANGSLTEVERSSCSLYPQVTGLSGATAGLHYEADQVRECDEDYASCDYYSKVSVNYRYTEVKIIDYYNEAGKVVTSKTVKAPQGIEDYEREETVGTWDYSPTGYVAADAAAKAQLARLYSKTTDGVVLTIRKRIYEGEEVCSNSYYK